MATPERPRKRPARSTIALRWAAVAALALVAFLYYRPLHSYLSTRDALAQRRAEVAQLRTEHALLQRRLGESAGKDALQRQARTLGLVKPGERLFIVKGINAWLRHHR
jgi:cell division protein FtsB